MSGGGGSQTTTQKADPWTGLQPHLLSMYGMADLYGAGPVNQYYPGSPVAGFNPIQQMGHGSGIQYANQLPGMMAPMYGGLDMLMQGYNPQLESLQKGLDPSVEAMVGMTSPTKNPYLDQMVADAMGQAGDVFQQQMGGVYDEMQGAGQNIGDTAYLTGTDFASKNLGDMLKGISTQMYGGAYSEDMNRALSASNALQQLYGGGMGTTMEGMARGIGLAPGAYQAGMMPFNIYGDIGSAYQGLQQKGIDADMARYFYNQDAPFQHIANYGQLLGMLGNPGGTTTSETEGPGPDIGGTAASAAIMGMAGINPMFALLGLF